MLASVLLYCLGVFLLGTDAAQGDVIRALLPKLQEDINAEIEIPSLSDQWEDNQSWIDHGKRNIDCTGGAAWDLKKLQQIGDAIPRQTGIYGIFRFKGLLFNYLNCHYDLFNDVHEDGPETGLIGDHKLIIKVTPEPVGASQCRLTVTHFVVDSLKKVIVDEKGHLEFTTVSFKQILEKLRSLVKSSIEAELAKFVGKSYTVDVPCN